LLWLAIFGVVMAVIGAFYYLRVIRYMFFEDAVDQAPLSSALDLKLVISANSLLLLGLGIFPGLLLDLCARVL
jgi:NADH-quinone oxidoreductase subunit N